MYRVGRSPISTPSPFVSARPSSRNRSRPDSAFPNAGYQIRFKEGYFPTPPADTLQDLRTEIMLKLMECGIEIERQHHEVATGGQCEVDMRHGPLLRTADNLLLYKYAPATAVIG